MLIVIGSLKGAPGATTFALALAATWPQPDPRPVVVEADPAGGQIGSWWRFFEQPGLWSMAAQLRRSDRWQAREHAIHLAVDVDVVAGQATDSAVASQILADRAAAIDGGEVVIADVGRLERGGRCAGFLAAADHVLIVTRPTEADLALVHGRARGLAQDTAGRMWLVTVGSNPYASEEILAALGVPLAGKVPHDNLGAAVMRGQRWLRHWRLLRLPRHAAVIGHLLRDTGPLLGPGSRDPDSTAPAEQADDQEEDDPWPTLPV